MNYGLRMKGETLDEIKEWSQKAEAAGFDRLWAEELHTTPFVYPAAVAGFTSRITLGSCIALAFTRSPMVTAITALDLDRLTNGRYILGVGTGVRRLIETWHGVPYGRPAPHLKETVQIVRLIMDNCHTGQPIQFKGQYYNIDIKGYVNPHKQARRVPIYVGAIGDGMTRMAAEVGDGLLGQIMPSIKWVKDVILPNVEIGLARSGRKRSDLDISPSISVAISEDVHKAKRDLAKTVSFYCTVGTYQELFAHYGFANEAAAVREQFQKKGGHGPHCFDLVTDEMVDAFFVAGTPDDARRRLKEYDGLVDSVILSPPSYFLLPEENSEYQYRILETFAR